MTTKQIKIDVDEKIQRFDLDKIEPLQGSLKHLAPADHEKLKASILKRGFFAPLFLWSTGKSKLKLIDGHQRRLVLLGLEEEGYQIPKIPGVLIKAKTEKEAKEKLLAVTSQFGKIRKEGLFEFMQGMDEKLISTDFTLPNLNSESFLKEYFTDSDQNPLDTSGADLGSVGGNSAKTLQLIFEPGDHGKVLRLIKKLQKKYETEHAPETVLMALEEAAKD